ncbi:glutaredoxin-C1-like protein [Tanacetum coccineum]
MGGRGPEHKLRKHFVNLFGIDIILSNVLGSSILDAQRSGETVKRLLFGMGVSPTIYELDDQVDLARARDIERALRRLVGNLMSVPVVFVGGKLVGVAYK